MQVLSASLRSVYLPHGFVTDCPIRSDRVSVDDAERPDNSFLPIIPQRVYASPGTLFSIAYPLRKFKRYFFTDGSGRRLRQKVDFLCPM